MREDLNEGTNIFIHNIYGCQGDPKYKSFDQALNIQINTSVIFNYYPVISNCSTRSSHSETHEVL